MRFTYFTFVHKEYLVLPLQLRSNKQLLKARSKVSFSYEIDVIEPSFFIDFQHNILFTLSELRFGTKQVSYSKSEQRSNLIFYHFPEIIAHWNLFFNLVGASCCQSVSQSVLSVLGFGSNNISFLPNIVHSFLDNNKSL